MIGAEPARELEQQHAGPATDVERTVVGHDPCLVGMCDRERRTVAADVAGIRARAGLEAQDTCMIAVR